MALLFGFLARLPLPVLHNLGAVLGWCVWLASPAYRRHLRENITQAGFCPSQFAAIAEAGKGVIELPRLWREAAAEPEVHASRVVRVTGWALVEAAWQAGRGIIFLTPHLGCFEITAQHYARHAPITVLYRRPRQAWLAALVEAGRGANLPNLRLAPADVGGVRRLLRALKSGEAVGLLPDQAPGAGEGVWAPFFGRPAYSMTLAARLAQTPATLLFAYAERLHYGAGYHLRLFAPTVELTGPLEARVALINQQLEALIAQCPEQYLWGYNRYKIPAGAPPPAP